MSYLEINRFRWHDSRGGLGNIQTVQQIDSENGRRAFQGQILCLMDFIRMFTLKIRNIQ